MKTQTSPRPAADARFPISKVEARTGLHRTTIRRRVKDGTFPEPHYLGANRMWWLSDIDQWAAEEAIRGAERAAAKRARFGSRAAP